MYKILVWIIKKLVGWKLELQVEGLNNLPKSGPAIIVFNHVDFSDALILPFVLRRDLVGIVAQDYIKVPVVPIFWAIGHAILVKRGKKDVKALTKAKKVLQRGGFLTIAPEGTRSRTGILKQGKYGPAYLAANAGCPVIPVAIIGTKDGLDAIWERFFSKWRLDVVVKIGNPIKISVPENGQHLHMKEPTLNKQNQGKYTTPQSHAEKNFWQQITNTQIMPKIAEMLPDNMRGEF